ncbi:MAG: hypothetical protein Q7W45_09040 [Bacteroidota bacterium]|nr:hypothetical protein [Bacteroidota bacterium]MDP3144178.1 hypothetical protein [Bacteroidota bacterium]
MFYIIEKYFYSIILIPLDIVILSFIRTIIFKESSVSLINNVNFKKGTLEFSYDDIKEVSPLTRPSGFKIKFKSGVSSEFFFTIGDELKPFYTLLLKNKVNVNPKDFTYLSDLLFEIKKELNKKQN